MTHRELLSEVWKTEEYGELEKTGKFPLDPATQE
jgi:hypothetical protein